jgi:hypothetical protein
MAVTKLTSALLKKIVREEASKFGGEEDTEERAKDTVETDADEYADALEKHLDYVKALKIEENRIIKRLSKIRETRQRVLRKIVTKVV